jgi:hypothetical protein
MYCEKCGPDTADAVHQQAWWFPHPREGRAVAKKISLETLPDILYS